jgi:hypothetical protein
MSFTTCAYCSGRIDPSKDEVVDVALGQVHKACYEKRQQAKANMQQRVPTPAATAEKKVVERKSRQADMKKCPYCDKKFDITKEEYCMVSQRRYAHKECYDKYHTEDDDKVEDIYTFLREEVLITCDRAQCEKQRKNFITKFGYTNEGILNALKYFYKVKKQSPEKSGNRIGIVPYVYNEAKAYYESLERKQKQLTKTAVEQMNKKPRVIKVMLPEKPVDKGFIDLDTIEKGAD